MTARLRRLAVLIGAVAAGIGLGMYFGGAPGVEMGIPTSSGAGFSLALPAFAQSAGRSFLEEEAGISAYVKLGQTIDLGRARGMYSVLEDETETYLIGTIKLLDYDETWWPHVWIQKDGWIVVYYNKAEPTSKLIHWPGYRDGRITTTTLREALLSVGRELGLSIASLEEGLRYYHWQHPDASRMLVVVGTRDFKYTIPSAITVCDASWALRASSVRSQPWYSSAVDMVVDGTRITRVSVGDGQTVTTTHTGSLDGRYLTPGDAHEASIARGARYGGGWEGIALVFVYR